MEIVFSGLRWLIHSLQPLLVPVCFVCAWTLVAMTVWQVWSSMRDGISQIKEMHQIPCANCRFFTGNYQLKCTVHPDYALSEQAINCLDYESVDEGSRIEI